MDLTKLRSSKPEGCCVYLLTSFVTDSGTVCEALTGHRASCGTGCANPYFQGSDSLGREALVMWAPPPPFCDFGLVINVEMRRQI